MNRRTTFLSILYPFLLGSYPVLHLLAANEGQIPLSAGLRSLLICLLLTGVLLGLSLLVLRNVPRAALVTAILLVLIFSYGHVYEGLKAVGLSGTTIVRHRYLLPLWAILFAVLAWIALRRVPSPRVTEFMAVVGAAAVVITLTQIGIGEARARASRIQESEGDSCTLPPLDGRTAPDIYLIIMDSYGREDALQDLFGYDNRAFLQELRDRGFYVADGSLSNYRWTPLSIASLLNMDYIQSFSERYSREENYAFSIAPLIPANRLRRELECLGYATVAFETGTHWAAWEDADFYIEMDPSPFGDLRLLGSISDFEEILLTSSLARAVLDEAHNRRAAIMPPELDPASLHRQRILFEFDQLERTPSLPSPKLVYAHILAPHVPIVFGPNGESISEAEFGTGWKTYEGGERGAYADEVNFLNQRLLQIVDALLADSETPPVIVIMGDHGWLQAHRTHEDFHKILNAIYLPGGADDLLYPTITPVNTFRVVLRRYFGADLELLPDVSYFSTGKHYMRFERMPNTWKPPE